MLVDQSEKTFLFDCLSAFVQPKGPASEAVSEMDLGALHWKSILNFGQTHRVLPFMRAVLGSLGRSADLPAHVWMQLNQSASMAEWENWVKMMEFKKINGLLEHEKIPVCLLKGMGLLETVYQDHRVRTMGDMDLLIPEKTQKKTRRLVCEQGFTTMAYDYRWHSEMMDLAKGRSNYQKGDLHLDLQWAPRFMIGGRMISWDVAEAWKNAKPFPALGSNVFLLSPLDHARYLNLQIRSDRQVRRLFLYQLLDLALMMKTYGLAFSDIAASQDLEQLMGEWLSGKKGTYVDFGTRLVTQDDFYGETVMQSPISWRDKLLFLAGYFFPGKNYLERQFGESHFGYLLHLRRLLVKTCKRGVSKITHLSI